MPFTGLLALTALLAQAPAPQPAPPALVEPHATPIPANDPVRCPENLRLDTPNVRLIDVPETMPQLADKTGGVPGWVSEHLWPVPCVTPARR